MVLAVMPDWQAAAVAHLERGEPALARRAARRALAATDPVGPNGPSSSASRTPLAVPVVSNPLDATRFLDAPCDLITAQQAGELGLPFAEEERSAGPVTCVWRADQNDPNPLEALQIRFHTGDGGGRDGPAVRQQDRL